MFYYIRGKVKNIEDVTRLMEEGKIEFGEPPDNYSYHFEFEDGGSVGGWSSSMSWRDYEEFVEHCSSSVS